MVNRPSIADTASYTIARRVLVVDDERHILETVRLWLTRAGWECQCAASVSEALSLSKDPGLSLALIDYRLDGKDVGIRLGRVLQHRRSIPFMLFSGFLNTDVVVSAVRAGALAVIDKPLTESGIRGVVAKTALDEVGFPGLVKRAAVNEIGTAARRWGGMVLGVCLSHEDPYKIGLWARLIGVSATVLRETCRLSGVSANQSCDLARFMRAIALNQRVHLPLADYFAVADQRTLMALFDRAGIGPRARDVRLQDFLRKQRFISTSRLCLRELAHRAANSRLFFS